MSKRYDAFVTRVVDADTIDVRVRQEIDFLGTTGTFYREERIRLLGTDAYERYTTKGDDATDRVREMLPSGFEVVLRTDDERDSFGRLLAHILIPTDDGDRNLGAWLRSRGLATRYEQPTPLSATAKRLMKRLPYLPTVLGRWS